MLSTQLVTPPAVEPVSLATAKTHLRVDVADDDALISALITAARQWAENYCNRAFYEQTWTLSLDAFPFWYGFGTVPTRQRHSGAIYSAYWDALAIRVPRPSLVSVTSITYVDTTNTTQTLDPSAYFVDIAAEPARITPQTALSWPTSHVYLPNTVKVTYIAGSYGDGVEVNNCPQTVVAAILLMLGHLYNHRGDDTAQVQPPPAVAMLLDSVRVPVFSYESN